MAALIKAAGDTDAPARGAYGKPRVASAEKDARILSRFRTYGHDTFTLSKRYAMPEADISAALHRARQAEQGEG